MDEKGAWGHYHKWRRIQEENDELKKIIILLGGGEYLIELAKKQVDKQEKTKVKSQLKKLGLQ
jgi:hypothetical protein|tara:strand:+ start:3899 stop:4087 length:189 start_codon:yes stop_codon:yes gene_type:complete